MSRRALAYKNVLSLQVSRILTKVFQVFFLAVAARVLGTDGFGQWSLVLLLVGFFGLIADFGVDRWTVRDVARDLSRSREYLANTLVFKSLSIVPATLLLLVVVHVARYPPETLELFYIGVPILVLGVLSSPFGSIIQAHEKIYLLSAIDVIQGMATSIVGVTLLFLGYGLRSLLVMSVVLAALRFLVMAMLTRRILGGLLSPVRRGFLRALAKNSFPFAALRILTLIHWKVDYFMISKILDTSALGLFAAPYKVFENIAMMGVAFNTALYPSISALFGESKEKLRRVYEGLQKYFIIVSIPIAVIVFTFAREIILLLYGVQYLESVPVLIILSCGFGLLFFSIPMRLIINNSDLIMKLVPYSAVTTALNVLLNLAVIPRYGIVGAAMASLLAGTVDVTIRMVFIRRVFPEGSHPLNSVWKPVAAGFVMISIILLLSALNRYLAVLLGLAAYFYSLGVMGALSRDEYRRFFREPMGRIFSSLVAR